jgi:predicted nuclease of predicted toxin-antitoxin system
MQILVDGCVGRSVVETLRSADFDVEWVAEWGRDPGDREILGHALLHGQVLVTRDKDFGELIFRDRLLHCGVVRLVGALNYREQADFTLRAVTEHGPALVDRHVVTVEVGRIRVSRDPTH